MAGHSASPRRWPHEWASSLVEAARAAPDDRVPPSFTMSGRQDLNLRPLDPQNVSSGVPARQRPAITMNDVTSAHVAAHRPRRVVPRWSQESVDASALDEVVNPERIKLHKPPAAAFATPPWSMGALLNLPARRRSRTTRDRGARHGRCPLPCPAVPRRRPGVPTAAKMPRHGRT
jgi:hypothetical protein